MSRPVRHGERGFTLVETVIAMAILFGALVMMLSKVTADVNDTNRAKLLSAAVGLARGKMLDIEEELAHTGFQDTSEEMEGDFSDDGFPRYKWKAMVEKVKLPALQQLQEGGKDASGEEGGGVGSGLTGLMGQGGGNATAAAGAATLSSQFDMVSNVLEMAIRKVTLTVTWKVGNVEEKMVVVCYFTDPKAVDAAMSGINALTNNGQNQPQPPGGPR
jgi:general secretion pathway protein I